MSNEQPPTQWPQPPPQPQPQPTQPIPGQYPTQQYHPQSANHPGQPMIPPAAPKATKGHKRWIIVTRQASGKAAPDLSAKNAELQKREVAVALRESKVAAAEQNSKQQAPPPAAAETISDGTYIVGTDIQPGEYRSRTADDLCYWARLKSTDGGLGSIIANNLSNGGQQIVTIKRTDKAFETRDCGTWSRVK
jgi:hypothetical protein